MNLQPIQFNSNQKSNLPWCLLTAVYYKPQRLCWLTLNKMKPQIRIPFNLFTLTLSSQNFSKWPVRVFLQLIPYVLGFNPFRPIIPFLILLFLWPFFSGPETQKWTLTTEGTIRKDELLANASTCLLYSMIQVCKLAKRTWFICTHKFIDWRKWNRECLILHHSNAQVLNQRMI